MEKRFDVHGWNYDDAEVRLGEFMVSVISNGNAAGYRTWRLDQINRTEGKAFGLSLCEILAQGSPFTVPAWFNAESREVLTTPWGECWLETHPGPYMVRSSSHDEDWIDPRSGVGQSKWCKPEYLSRVLAEHFATSKNSVVIQQYAWGCGCVIDVGFNELLERPIVRVAQGNPNFIGGGYNEFTSATWDHESHVAIYDAESGEHLAGSKLGFRHYDNPFPGLVKELIKMLDCPNFNFGLQLEVIVDPHTDLWHLVQIRPSPESVRGMKEKPEIRGKLLSTTGKVNKPGDVSGPIVHISEDWRNKSELDEQLHHAMYVISSGSGEIEPTLAGKIVHWDFGRLLEHKYASVLPVFAVSLMGAIGQTCQGFLFGNSAHGTYIEYDDERKEQYERCWQSGVQLGRVGDEFERMVRWNKGPEINVRLVSDGLVGQIYLLD